MSILENIVNGWGNYLTDKLGGTIDPEIKQQASERAEICLACKHFNKKIKACNVCGCKFPAIVFAPKKECPKKKWEKMILNADSVLTGDEKQS